jgi:hypothetical protein
VTAPAAAPRLEIVAGRADDVRAEIVVMVAADAAAADTAVVSGTLAGPHRGRDVTLPVTARLAPLAASPGMVVGRFLVTEPAYWSPALPNLYRLRLSVVAAGREPATIDRFIGLRRLGVRGRSLWLEGRRWVPRGVAGAAGEFSPATLRDLAAAAELVDPASAECAAADAAGVAIVARLPVAADAVERVAAFAVHPSVVLAVLPGAVPDAAEAAAVRRAKGTMLVAVEVDGGRPPPEPAAVAGRVDCLVVGLRPGALPHDAWREWPTPLPLLARRGAGRTAGLPGVGPSGGGAEAEPVGVRLAAARRACDRLQADLAAWAVAGTAGGPIRDWAGYLAG